ncbi:hypothetical protein P170DRAFT_25921 [Aspergillus steynii IBT 23096]|uniref:Uncharacterized protein n=1 Tax=Aspergillus steynii IBT 23096 TaxID=1392250 RepID=A0A2I2GPP3_9EURO|nr:uncharacterized protein P170DRAFT_25921 [Aspergillus steynii IBT 23096]PLB54839.1 hypothetical protein P170DRAFT_25921 [Aspergillus steynii IBT 23096]
MLTQWPAPVHVICAADALLTHSGSTLSHARNPRSLCVVYHCLERASDGQTFTYKIPNPCSLANQCDGKQGSRRPVITGAISLGGSGRRISRLWWCIIRNDVSKPLPGCVPRLLSFFLSSAAPLM